MLHETAKHTHHQSGVLPSMMPQTFSVIQAWLRLFRTRTGRGLDAGLTSARTACVEAEISTLDDIS